MNDIVVHLCLLGDTIMAVNGMTVDLETVNTLLGALSNEVRL